MSFVIWRLVIHLMLTSGIQKQFKYTKEGLSHGVWHIEHLKRWTKKAWQCAINREEEEDYISISTLSQISEASGGGAID